MDVFFIFIAQYFHFVALAVAFVLFLKLSRDNKKKIVIFACISLPIIGLFTLIAGHVYYDPRPFVEGHFAPLIPHDPDNGFPSDHILLLSAIAALLFPFNRKGSCILWVLAFLVAIARVYVGVHHVVDVIGSVAIVSLGSYIGYTICKRKIFPKNLTEESTRLMQSHTK